MKFFAVLAAVAVSSAAAQTCNLSALAPLLPTAQACGKATGLVFPPTAVPTADVLKKTCTEATCQELLTKVANLNLGDCQLGAVKIDSQLIEPIKKECGSATGPSTAANGTAAAGASAASSAAGSTSGVEVTTPEVTTVTPVADKATTTGSTASSEEGSGWTDAAETPSSTTSVPSPTPSSGASAVSVAVGAVIVAGAASML